MHHGAASSGKFRSTRLDLTTLPNSRTIPFAGRLFRGLPGKQEHRVLRNPRLKRSFAGWLTSSRPASSDQPLWADIQGTPPHIFALAVTSQASLPFPLIVRSQLSISQFSTSPRRFLGPVAFFSHLYVEPECPPAASSSQPISTVGNIHRLSLGQNHIPLPRPFIPGSTAQHEAAEAFHRRPNALPPPPAALLARTPLDEQPTQPPRRPPTPRLSATITGDTLKHYRGTRT